MLNYYIERQKWTRPSSLNIVYIYVIRGSHENRTLAIKHVPRKSWQHYCYVSTLLTLKTHRSTQLFLYCSGGERRVKCVRPALKMEASKEVWFVSWWLRVLLCTIKSKHPGMLSDRIILLQDNVSHHSANLVRDKLQRFGWETLQHPPFSSDLSPCDFHVFGDLKKAIPRHRFHSDEEVQEWVRLWIHQRPTSFYKTEIDRLVSQWDKCINTSGNYF